MIVRATTPVLVLLLAVLAAIALCSSSSLVIAQTNASTYLTYTNTDYGFTIKYPADWTIDDKNVSNYGVKFTSPDTQGGVLVNVTTLRPNETSLSGEEYAKHIISHSPPGFKALEFDTNTYFLSGHPAARVIGLISLGGPGEPGASQRIVGDVKFMAFVTTQVGKAYNVGYLAPLERYADNLQPAQIMIDSFQIISKQ
jgi:hypothetical protein